MNKKIFSTLIILSWLLTSLGKLIKSFPEQKGSYIFWFVISVISLIILNLKDDKEI